MQVNNVVLVDRTARGVPRAELSAVAGALQLQIERDFEPVWGRYATVGVSEDRADLTATPIYLLDALAFPGAGGIHLNSQGSPYAEVVDADRWTIAASHELLEMLVDPMGNLLIQGPDQSPAAAGDVLYLMEVCDPCETFSYTIRGVPVSDFVLPTFYEAPVQAQGWAVDHLQRLAGPLAVSAGGFLSWFDPADGRWHQKLPDGHIQTAVRSATWHTSRRSDRDSSFPEPPGDEIGEVVISEYPRHGLHRLLGDLARGSISQSGATASSEVSSAQFHHLQSRGAMADVGNFRPSTHGLHFVNGWPAGTPDLIIATPLGNVSIGDASNGLCGGFCFAAADLYIAGRQPPPDTTSPPGGSPMVTYLTWRLLASWNIPGGILTYYAWANTPDHDTLLGVRPGVARMTIQDQIPQITQSIDRGQLATLGLVTIYSADPGQLGHCHQVLAYAYEWQGSYFKVMVYDPNSPNNDGIYIGMDTSNPGHTTTIDHNVNIGYPIRGFFFVQYSAADPSAVAGPPWKEKEKDKDKEKEKDKDKEKEKDKDRKDSKDVMKDKDKDNMKEKDRDQLSADGNEAWSGWPLAGE